MQNIALKTRPREADAPFFDIFFYALYVSALNTQPTAAMHASSMYALIISMPPVIVANSEPGMSESVWIERFMLKLLPP